MVHARDAESPSWEVVLSRGRELGELLLAGEWRREVVLRRT